MKELRHSTPLLRRWICSGTSKTPGTNTRHLAHFGFMTLLALGVLLPVARGQESAKTQVTIPLIQMADVPLKDAIRNLARQAGLNFILDPKLDGPWEVAEGKPGRAPSVNARWENLTAEQALGKVLKEHGLVMIANPATSVARIAFRNQAVQPVPDSAVAGGTNAVIPLIVMDMVPLPDAIRNLARQAQLNLDIDPALPVTSAASVKRTISDYNVSIRWENVTARQALVAILDNFDLVLVELPATASAKIAACELVNIHPPDKANLCPFSVGGFSPA
jgi:hypothetical protein